MSLYKFSCFRFLHVHFTQTYVIASKATLSLSLDFTIRDPVHTSSIETFLFWMYQIEVDFQCWFIIEASLQFKYFPDRTQMEACTKHHKIILPSPLTSLLLLARNVDENGHGVLLILLLKEAKTVTKKTQPKWRSQQKYYPNNYKKEVWRFSKSSMQLLRLFLDMGNFVEFWDIYI